MKKTIIWIIYIVIIFILIASVFFNFNKNKDIKLTSVKVAEVTHSIFYAPQYVAIHNGYFKELGIDVELVLAPGADKVTAAVLSGDVDIGFCGSEATIYVYNAGEKDYLKTFAQLTQKDGSFLVGRNKNDNFKLNDLVGKMIIGGRKGGMPEMVLEWALRDNGIDPSADLVIDTSIAFASMSGAFIGGTGDYVALFEPTASLLEKQGYGYIVASLGEIGGIVPYTAYNARISYLENNTEVISNFTKAIQKGLDFVLNNDSKTVAKVIQVEFPDTSLNDIIKVLDRYKAQNTWPSTTTFSKESFDHLQDIIVASGQLDNSKRVNYEDLTYEPK